MCLKKIKKKLTSDLFLAHYNPDLNITVASDASSYGVGACILSKMNDGTTKPIAHKSRALLPAKKNYLWFEKEALGIIFVVSKFHSFIHGQHYATEWPQAITHHFNSKKGLPIHTANKLQRWGTILLNYNFIMMYQPSNKFGHADGLSRLIPKYKEPLEDTVMTSLKAN